MIERSNGGEMSDIRTGRFFGGASQHGRSPENQGQLGKRDGATEAGAGPDYVLGGALHKSGAPHTTRKYQLYNNAKENFQNMKEELLALE
jgi:hypothetical protein